MLEGILVKVPEGKWVVQGAALPAVESPYLPQTRGPASGFGLQSPSGTAQSDSMTLSAVARLGIHNSTAEVA